LQELHQQNRLVFVMTIWGSQSVQFAWFVPSIEGLVASRLYEPLVGHEPDATQRNKVISQALPFLSSASGNVDGAEYQVLIAPGRIDFTITAAPAIDEPRDDVALLDTRAVIDGVLDRFKSVGPTWPDALRLAVVAHLFKPMANYQEANADFFKITGLDFNLSDLRDTVLQLNRRKRLNASLEINRVVRYAVLGIQQFAMGNPVPEKDVLSPFYPINEQRFGTSLLLDFNTNPGGWIFQVAEQVTICNELASELYRVANIGSPQALAD
jgi:hypothetical protein